MFYISVSDHLVIVSLVLWLKGEEGESGQALCSEQIELSELELMEASGRVPEAGD